MEKCNNKVAFLLNEKKKKTLPIAVRQLSISPFISRSIALATSTLLYLEYLSNTDREDQESFLAKETWKQRFAKQGWRKPWRRWGKLLVARISMNMEQSLPFLPSPASYRDLASLSINWSHTPSVLPAYEEPDRIYFNIEYKNRKLLQTTASMLQFLLLW